jgi:hypothetical protein
MRTPRLHWTKRWIATFAIVGLVAVGVTSPVAAASRDAHVIGSLRLSPGTLVTVAVAKAGLSMSGRVVFRSATGKEINVDVGKSGRFSVNLRPGTYTAFGGGRGWFPNCHYKFGRPFTITGGHTSNVVVWCLAI